MPSGPKKRKAARRKQAKSELVLSTGATESCIGSMKTVFTAEVSTDAVQLSQKIDEHVLDVLPSTEPPALMKINNAVYAPQQFDERAFDTLQESVVMELLNGSIPKEIDCSNEGISVPEAMSEVQVCNTSFSGLADEKSSVAALVSDDAALLSQQIDEHVIDVLPSTKTLLLKKLCDAAQVSLQLDENAFNKLKELVNVKDGGMSKENDCSNVGFSVHEVMSGVQACNTSIPEVAVEKTDVAALVSSDDVLLSHQIEEQGFDVFPSTEPTPLMKVQNAVQVSQLVEEHAVDTLKESEVVELVDGEHGHLAKENDTSNDDFSIQEDISALRVCKTDISVVALGNDVGSDAIQLASMKDEKDIQSVVGEEFLLDGSMLVDTSEKSQGAVLNSLAPSAVVGVDDALTGNFLKLLDLVEKIDDLVQEVKGLVTQTEQM